MSSIESVTVQLSQLSLRPPPTPGLILVLHPQPGPHDLSPIGPPTGSKGGLLAQESFIKQRVEVLRTEVTVVLVT